jgi:hypothetical protein
MASFRLSTLAYAALAAVGAVAQPACCAYGGNGAAIIDGMGMLDINDGRGTRLTPITLAGDPTSAAVVVLVNASTPEDAVAGWIITQNSTMQLMTLWYNNNEAGAPYCSQGTAPLDAGFVPGFAMCPGTPKGVFPIFGDSYSIGTVAVNTFTQPSGGVLANFLTSEEDCALVSLMSGCPLNNNGAFAFNAEFGQAVARVPDKMFALPSFC